MDELERRQALAAFLRTRRTRLQPADVGLPSRSRRQTPVWGALLPEIRQLIVDLWEYGPGNRKGLLVPGRKLYGLGTPLQRLSQ
jgi:hypothetical protein